MLTTFDEIVDAVSSCLRSKMITDVLVSNSIERTYPGICSARATHSIYQ